MSYFKTLAYLLKLDLYVGREQPSGRIRYVAFDMGQHALDLRDEFRTLTAERDQLRARVAELEKTLSDERAIAVVDCAARDAFIADNARLREQGREVLIHIMRSHKASIGSIDSHYTPQLSVTKVHEIAEAFGIKP